MCAKRHSIRVLLPLLRMGSAQGKLADGFSATASAVRWLTPNCSQLKGHRDEAFLPQCFYACAADFARCEVCVRANAKAGNFSRKRGSKSCAPGDCEDVRASCCSGQDGCTQASSARSAATKIRKVQTGERARRHSVRGSSASSCCRQPVVSRGSGERTPGPHGLRASSLAHDV